MMLRNILLIAIVWAANARGQGYTLAPAQVNTTVKWSVGDPQSDQVLRGGLPVRILVKDGVAVSASLARNDDVLWANVTVTNRSGKRFDVDPSQFTLTEVSPRQKEVLYESPDKVVKFIKRRADWANAFSGIAADMSRDKTTTDAEINTKRQSTTDFDLETRPHRYSVSGTARSNGSERTTATVTTDSPDYQARMESARTIERNTAAAESKSADILKRALLANTLMPGEDIGGAVFFERDKKLREAVLRVPVAGLVFEFPVSIEP
ncbi:MAG TPA: hypothetical protein VF105_02995 [Gemmatimonadaceae bacterium]